MNGHGNGNLRTLVLLAGILSMTGGLFAQDTAKPDATKKILIVNGKTVDAVILEVEGSSYVDIQSLADNANGTVTFESGIGSSWPYLRRARPLRQPWHPRNPRRRNRSWIARQKKSSRTCPRDL